MQERSGSVSFSSNEHSLLSLSPASNPTTTTTPVTGDHTADAPSSSIASILRPAPTPESITATSSTNTTTFRTRPTNETISDVPLSTTITTNTPTSSDVDSVTTGPHRDRTFASRMGLINHLRIHRTESG
ncbi:hypothetical protein SprV_0802509000 [Sparganum proliferum]